MALPYYLRIEIDTMLQEYGKGSFYLYNSLEPKPVTGLADVLYIRKDLNEIALWIEGVYVIKDLNDSVKQDGNTPDTGQTLRDGIDANEAEVTNNTNARHSHLNKPTLDNFGEDANGEPTYNGVKVDTTIAQRDVYDGLDSLDNTISLSANNGKVLKDVQDTQQTAIDLNTAKETNIAHPLVETAVPINALFTDTIYEHPTNHPATIIAQTSSYRFVTDAEKATWNSKAIQQDIIDYSEPLNVPPIADNKVAVYNLDGTRRYEDLPEADKSLFTIADLQAETVNFEGKAVEVLGYYTKGDGGGGLFYWDAASTEADNGGTIIQATAITTGRWKRVLSGAVNVKWFGAKGDGVDDDAPYIRTAQEEASKIKGGLFIPEGKYMCLTPHPVTGHVMLILDEGVDLKMDKKAWLTTDIRKGDGGFLSAAGNNTIICNIDGNAIPDSGDVSEIDGWKEWAVSGIWIAGDHRNAENIIIKDSIFTGLSYCVFPYGAKNYKISGNRFYKFRQSGIQFKGYTDTHNYRNIIQNNHFEEGGDAAVVFWMSASSGNGHFDMNSVIGNTAINMNLRSSGYAYDVEQSVSEYLNRFLFANNTYYVNRETSTSKGGITISTARNSVVIGNILKADYTKTNGTGITTNSRFDIGDNISENNIISENIIEGFIQAGISTDGAINIAVTNNTIINCSDDVPFKSAIRIAAYFTSQEITVKGNRISVTEDFTKEGGYGISCYTENIDTNPNKIYIGDNTITGYKDYCIMSRGNLSINTVVKNIYIENNVFYNSSSYCISFREVVNYHIKNNIMTDCYRGFSIEGGINGVVRDNIFTGDSTLNRGFLLSNVEQLKLENNIYMCPVTTKKLVNGTSIGLFDYDYFGSKPIQTTYATEAAMHADQLKQLKGYFYVVTDVGHFEYLGTIVGDTTDYRFVGKETVDFSTEVKNTPTTIVGYGIADAETSSQIKISRSNISYGEAYISNYRNSVLNDGATFFPSDAGYEVGKLKESGVMNDCSLLLLTSAVKAVTLYSVKPQDRTGDFTVDRNSTATYIDEDGLIKTSLANVPRIDYSSGEAALLVELQSTNLYLNSATLATQNISTTASIYTVSFYGTGTITFSSSYVGSLAGAGAAVRVSKTFTATAGTLTSAISGTVTEGQCENLTHPTSYIPTNGTTETRLEDNIYNDTLNYSGDYTIFFEIDRLINYGGGSTPVLKIVDSLGNVVSLYTNGNQSRYNIYLSDDGGYIYGYGNNSSVVGVNKLAISLENDIIKFYVNGVAIGDTYSTIYRGLSSINLLSNQVSKSIFSIKAFKKALTDQQLMDLTT